MQCVMIFLRAMVC